MKGALPRWPAGGPVGVRRGIVAGTLLAALLGGGCGRPVPGADTEFGTPEAPPPVEVAAVAGAAIDARDVRRRLDYLAAPLPPTNAPGASRIDRAAAWLTEQLQQAGVAPAGEDGGYLQFWPLESGDSTILVPNVVAVLPGSAVTRSQEHVIITAHFDPGTAGDSVPDNGSGIAALLAVAEALAALPTRPARPVLFLATSGGEHGSAGGGWFAAHPTVFLEHATAVLALERVGRGEAGGVDVVEYGDGRLRALLERLSRDAGDPPLRLRPVDAASERAAGGHVPLARRDIPTLLVTGGDGPAAGKDAPRADPRRVARLARLVFLAAHALATAESAP